MLAFDQSVIAEPLYLNDLPAVQALERLRSRHPVLDRLLAMRGIEPGGDADPYAILGISRDAPMDEVKAAYRRLAREHHPDRLVAEGLPEEMIQIATRKIAAINEAYDRILRLRGAR